MFRVWGVLALGFRIHHVLAPEMNRSVHSQCQLLTSKPCEILKHHPSFCISAAASRAAALTMWACRAAPCIGADGFKRLKSLASRKMSSMGFVVCVCVRAYMDIYIFTYSLMHWEHGIYSISTILQHDMIQDVAISW